jgi:hypothetical protein
VTPKYEGDAVTLSWKYVPCAEGYPQGPSVTSDNFKRESRDPLELLVREYLQNALDARTTPGQKVGVSISHRKEGEINSRYLREIFPQEFSDRLRITSSDLRSANNPNSVLVLEDFGTKGLIGDYQNSNKDGSNENWNGFWHREGPGSGAKSIAANGGAGQGKITYYEESLRRAVFGLTTRESDGKSLLYGRASFRSDYLFNGTKYAKFAFFCASHQFDKPSDDVSEIEKFTNAFLLQRRKETGLSLVIPDPREFRYDDALRAVIREFYIPVLLDRLEVSLQEHSLNSSSIDALADEYLDDDELNKKRIPFTTGYREFVRDALLKAPKEVTLSEAAITQRALRDDDFIDAKPSEIREQLKNGGILCFRMPAKVVKAAGSKSVFFKIYLQLMPEEASASEEAFLRGDLIIGDERHIDKVVGLQKARALTVIDDPELSRFLLDAEEPTHMKWNEGYLRDKGYKEYRVLLSGIRSGAGKVLKSLIGGIQEPDRRAAANYFPRPISNDEAGTKDGGKKPGERKNPSVTPKIPLRRPKYFEPNHGIGAVGFKASKKEPIPSDLLPLTAVLRVAYEGDSRNDPFDDYDPFDFDFERSTEFPITVSGGSIVSRKENRVELRIESTNFECKVEGLSPHLLIRATLAVQDGRSTASNSEIESDYIEPEREVTATEE